MPITVEHLEARIYRSLWIDFVSIDDVRAAVLRRQQLADEDKASVYAVIVDVNQAGGVPANLESLQQAIEADSRLVAIIVTGTNLPARILVERLSKITQAKVESAYSAEDAVKRARALLAEFDSKNE
jgi:hypothetical protein